MIRNKTKVDAIKQALEGVDLKKVYDIAKSKRRRKNHKKICGNFCEEVIADVIMANPNYNSPHDNYRRRIIDTQLNEPGASNDIIATYESEFSVLSEITIEIKMTDSYQLRHDNDIPVARFGNCNDDKDADVYVFLDFVSNRIFVLSREQYKNELQMNGSGFCKYNPSWNKGITHTGRPQNVAPENTKLFEEGWVNETMYSFANNNIVELFG